jgi:hypothetical protein
LSWCSIFLSQIQFFFHDNFYFRSLRTLKMSVLLWNNDAMMSSIVDIMGLLLPHLFNHLLSSHGAFSTSVLALHLTFLYTCIAEWPLYTITPDLAPNQYFFWLATGGFSIARLWVLESPYFADFTFSNHKLKGIRDRSEQKTLNK